MMWPPPTFAEVRSMLQLATETQARKDSRPYAFHAAAHSPAPPAPSASPTAQPPPACLDLVLHLRRMLPLHRFTRRRHTTLRRPITLPHRICLHLHRHTNSLLHRRPLRRLHQAGIKRPSSPP